jgi:2-oxoglutarate ferredoxin oxidoreductase subunit alpha
MPLTEICNNTYTDPRQRQLFKNIIYVGALSVLLDVEAEVFEKLFAEQYRGKEMLLDSNVRALHLGRDYAREHLQAPLGIRVQRADQVGDRIFTDGNSAAALGCVYGGATVAAWYPITPSSSVPEAFQKYCDKFRVDPMTGRSKYAIVQAEDELASIGMVVGAGWNGARAFTATSGPGISLMTEFIGLAYFAEIPVTIINVQRGGPSTGMPTRTQQSDLLACAYASHGDTKHVLLFPEDPHECFEHAAAALDLADRLQTPIFVMTDLDIGMNQRLCKPFAWDDARQYDRGKVMTAEELEAGKDFGRYKDVDGDGIPWRTCPAPTPPRAASSRAAPRATPMPLLRARAGLHLQHGAPAAQILHGRGPGAPAGAAPCGAAHGPGRDLFRLHQPGHAEALDVLEAEGVHLDAMRLRAFPFPRWWTSSSQPMNRCSWSNRTATPRCTPCWSTSWTSTRHASARCCTTTAHPSPRASLPRPSRSICRAPRPAQGGRMTYIAKPRLHHPTLTPTRSATRGATTRAASPRCARAAGTTPSRPPSSRPAGSSTSSPTAWPSSRASAAAPRRRTTSWAPRTASTPCTDACPRC